MPDESPEVIEQQMQETRDSLTQKVSALESQVVDTLHNATTSVSDIVDQVKTAVPESIAGMKETFAEVKESVSQQVKDTLDVSKRTRENPWAMVGGVAAVGFIAGMILFRRSYAAPKQATSTSASPASVVPVAAAAVATSKPSIKLPGWLDQIVDKLGDKMTEEVRKLGEVAVATASASLQSTVEQVLPKFLGHLSPAEEPVNRLPNDAERNGFHSVHTRL